MFEDKYFIQTSGTSMGAAMAPSYANTYMAYLEETNIFNEERWTKQLKCIYRFIDNIFGIWSGSHEEIEIFFQHLNRMAPRITLTTKTSKDTIEFLDVQIFKKRGKLETTIYTKLTDRNSILHAHSFHPRRTIESIPFSQFLKYRRIISEDEEYNNKMEFLKSKFEKRGYQPTNITTSVDKVSRISREEALKPKVKTEAEKLVYVTTYSQQSPKIIKKNWTTLTLDPMMKRLFPEPPLFAYNTSKSIREHLIKADFSAERETHENFKGTTLCYNCNNCNNLIKGNTITHPHKGYKIKLHLSSTCDSKNVIYGIRCSCSIYYVGMTTRKAKTRWSEHKSNIRTAAIKSPVSQHFKKERYNIAQIRFIILEQIKMPRRGGNIHKMLLQKETYWIEKLNTMQPNGMNAKWDLSCFL
ncbi:uncharacterized protein [Ambystoma mexicanum]|uniref:uncharacterized protein n=1 Tax=Ambystoma mexicanum TaxID=8296 RepID=UPI0037E8E85E